MDGRKNNGGHSTKGFAGRKPKADELKLIERLDEVIDKDEALQTLAKMAKKDFRALQLYLNYRWGKPKEKMDITTNEESLNIPVIRFGK